MPYVAESDACKGLADLVMVVLGGVELWPADGIGRRAHYLEERAEEITRLTRPTRQVIERARTFEGETVEVIEESQPSGS